jgi:hypothetical protein
VFLYYFSSPKKNIHKFNLSSSWAARPVRPGLLESSSRVKKAKERKKERKKETKGSLLYINMKK